MICPRRELQSRCDSYSWSNRVRRFRTAGVSGLRRVALGTGDQESALGARDTTSVNRDRDLTVVGGEEVPDAIGR